MAAIGFKDLNMAFVRKLLIGALCTLFTTAGKAGPLELVGEHPDEVLRPAATISGSLVVGALLVQEDRSEAMQFETVLPALPSGAFICVSMLSSNGLYEAHNTYKAETEWQGGPISIDYPSQHFAVLDALGPEELAVYASPGTCAETDTSVIYPVAWRPAAPTQGWQLRLFVNAFHADEVFVYVGESADDPVVCRKPEADVQTAFDFVCDFTLPGPETPQIEINRVKSGRIAPPDFFTLQVGAPG